MEYAEISHMNLEAVQTIEFPSIGSSQLGYITVAEVQKNIPFEIKRVYWTYYTPQNVSRGGHAHIKLKQIVFAVSGQIEFQMETRRGEKTIVKLEDPNIGLYIPPLTWREIKFSHNAVLLCLASELFEEADYIRVYDQYRAFLQHG